MPVTYSERTSALFVASLDTASNYLQFATGLPPRVPAAPPVSLSAAGMPSVQVATVPWRTQEGD